METFSRFETYRYRVTFRYHDLCYIKCKVLSFYIEHDIVFLRR